jgi:hypothetical protein
VIRVIRGEICFFVQSRPSLFLDYFSVFSAAAGLGLAFAAGLAAPLAGVCSDARSARVLTRLAALDRLRVFLRALVFGIGSGSLNVQDSK